MKTRSWILIFSALALLCIALSLMLLLPSADAAYVELWSEGALLQTLSLEVDQRIVVESSLGTNTVTIQDGKVAVTQASCPDHYCMKRGQCAGGPDVICLPNQLVIKFINDTGPDAVAG